MLGGVRIHFQRNNAALHTQEAYLVVTPEGAAPYIVDTTSGKGDCTNNPDCVDESFKGPIPLGDYTIDVTQLVMPGLFRVLKRALWDRLDWGSFKVPILPVPDNPTPRSNFYLHGGVFRGSAGCVDIGGGYVGDYWTARVVRDLRGDPDAVVPFNVSVASQ